MNNSTITMKQKFRRLTFVKVADEMPSYMSHFPAGFTGIVKGTYAQLCGGNDTGSYSLYKVDGDKITNSLSWYRENQLTKLEWQDAEKAERMIEEYIEKRK